MKYLSLPEKLEIEKTLTDDEFSELISSDVYDTELMSRADRVRRGIYGNAVYIRGLIEISSYCKNNCLYCGIRRGNTNAVRYRISKEDILGCCRAGYSLGFRTFVLQGGEDNFYSDDIMCDIISSIRKEFPDCAITLSLGEKSRESYKAYFAAGANRYLLRHETADPVHYKKLHPPEMSLENRKRCLFDLKEIGFQVGSGFMVASPCQTTENIIADLRFLKELSPDMIGIGPFIPHPDTPLGGFDNKNALELTLRLISILRLMFPHALLPATTALGTIRPGGREMGLMRGANVVMPNLSPAKYRDFYEIYKNKLHSGGEAAEGLLRLRKSVRECGYEVVTDIGNVRR